MKQSLHFPYELDTAAGNMARDMVLLRLSSGEGAVSWRFYGWNEPAFTFGYSQKWEWARAAAGPFSGSMVRRPTGGGLVDHRHDLTYALCLPVGHAAHRRPASRVYEELHGLVADTLEACRISCRLVPCNRGCGRELSKGSGICFQAPEPFDVLDPRTGKKLAGAAMKRTRDGILIQGSLELPETGAPIRTAVMKAFSDRIPKWLETRPGRQLHEFPLDLLEPERARFASVEWNRKR